MNVRIRLSDRKKQRLADLKNFVTAGFVGYSHAIAPDGSPLLLSNSGTQDVYSLDWEEP